MLPYDLHIHTHLNGHSPLDMTVPTILARADALGLQTIALTEHIMQPDNIAWIHDITQQLTQTSSACRVIIGAEIDADPALGTGQLVYQPDAALNLVLASLHRFPGTDLLPHVGQRPDLPRTDILQIWRRCFLGLAANPAVDIIAHPGAMIANLLPQEDFAPDVLEIFAQAARLSAQHGIAWELNRLLGNKLTPTQRFHYHRIPQLALDAGVSLVFGSDAHEPDEIAATTFVEDVVTELGGWSCLQNPTIPHRPNLLPT